MISNYDDYDFYDYEDMEMHLQLKNNEHCNWKQ